MTTPAARCAATHNPMPDIHPVILYTCRLPAGHGGDHSDHMKAREGDLSDRDNMTIREFPLQQYTWHREEEVFYDTSLDPISPDFKGW